MKRKHWVLISAIPGLLILWLLIVAIMIWSFGKKNHAKHSDCIIVLGAAVQGDKPSPVFEERINHAIALHQKGLAASLIFTGGLGDGDSHSESEVASMHAQSKGIPSAAIHTEEISKTTRQNLLEAKKLMKREGYQTAIIVSDPIHLKRASIMAMDLEITATSSPTSTSRYRSFKSKFGFLVREVYFLHHYWITGN